MILTDNQGAGRIRLKTYLQFPLDDKHVDKKPLFPANTIKTHPCESRENPQLGWSGRSTCTWFLI